MKLELLGFSEECLVPVNNSAKQLYLCRPVPNVGCSLYWLAGKYNLWFVKWDDALAVQNIEKSGIHREDARHIASYLDIDSLFMASALIHDFIKNYQRSNEHGDEQQGART